MRTARALYVQKLARVLMFMGQVFMRGGGCVRRRAIKRNVWTATEAGQKIQIEWDWAVVARVGPQHSVVSVFNAATNGWVMDPDDAHR